MMTRQQRLESKRRYRESEKGKIKLKEYLSRPEVKERSRLASIRFRKSDKYKIFSERRKLFP